MKVKRLTIRVDEGYFSSTSLHLCTRPHLGAPPLTDSEYSCMHVCTKSLVVAVGEWLWVNGCEHCNRHYGYISSME